VMNVGLYDRRVHAKCLAIFQAQIHRCLHDQLIDGLQRFRSQPVEGTVEGIVPRHRLAVEIRELAQRVPVGDPFAQLAEIPVLDALQDQGAQHLLWGQSIATGPGIFQAALQITSYCLDHLFVVVKKIADALQQRLQQNALLQQLPIGETDLRLRSSRHGSVLPFFRGLFPLPFQGFHITRCGLVEQLLQSTPVVHTAAYLRHKFFGNINRKTASFQATIQDVARMLFARQAGGAVLANARTAAQAERAKNGVPEAFHLILEPAPDIGGRFGLDRFHVLCVPHATHTCQEKNEQINRKNARNAWFYAVFRVSRQKLARAVDALILALHDDTTTSELNWVRMEAAWAPGEIGDARAIPALQQVARETNNLDQPGNTARAAL